MKKGLFLFAFVVSFSVFAQSESALSSNATPIPANTVLKEYSNIKQAASKKTLFNRVRNYPTQIVRIEGELDNSQSCEEIHEEIDNFFTNQITSDRFFYNTINYCIYDPDTELAIRFIINSYFDPLSDEAIEYLQNYLAEHNGRELLGVPFFVEDASGVVVSLNIDAGREESRDSSVLHRYRHDNSTYYFANNYDLLKDLIRDIRQRFYSNDPEIILPFLSKWFPSSSPVYEGILKNSNYVELQPERIFLMAKEPKIFTSYLRLYFAHHCSKYPNKRCL